jgi:hypothetical protein
VNGADFLARDRPGDREVPVGAVFFDTFTFAFAFAFAFMAGADVLAGRPGLREVDEAAVFGAGAVAVVIVLVDAMSVAIRDKGDEIASVLVLTIGMVVGACIGDKLLRGTENIVGGTVTVTLVGSCAGDGGGGSVSNVRWSARIIMTVKTPAINPTMKSTLNALVTPRTNSVITSSMCNSIS